MARCRLARVLRSGSRMRLKWILRTLGLGAALGLSMMTVGCPEDGPMEEAGESLDEAGEDMKEAADEAADETEEAVDDVTE